MAVISLPIGIGAGRDGAGGDVGIEFVMSIFASTGNLSREMVRWARKTFCQRTLPDGSHLQLEQRFDILPPPQKDGDTIIGASLKEFRATIIDGSLQWQPTGKTAIDYFITKVLK